MVVTGSRTERTRIETTVPVDVVSAHEIERSGRGETARALAALAPSFNSNPQTIADGTDHIDPASLRGLGPDQVLVLINGRRRHTTALVNVNGTFGRGSVGTDLNAIPSGAIKRIEILRDGAATQYGSDAIAGVINIVLKDRSDELAFTSSTGITGEGDGAQLKLSSNGGVALGERGFLNVTAEFLERGATNRAGTYTGTVYSDDRAVDDEMLRERGLTRKDFPMKVGESAATAGSIFYNMRLPFSDHAELYSFGGISHREGRAAGFYRFPKQVSQNVPELYPNGFLPEIHTRIDNLATTVGVRARYSGWDADLSLTHGRNAMLFNVEHSVNASLGTTSPTSFDAGNLSFSQTVVDFDLLRDIETQLFKSLAFVTGSEYRLERYAIEAGDKTSYSLGPETFGDPPQPKAPGAQVFPGFAPSNAVDRTRNNLGVYAGFESALTRWLDLDVAARFENYSDFGKALIGKGAARVAIVRGLALRGAFSTGFRAPSLHQLWFNTVSTLFVSNPDTNVIEPTQVLTSNNASPVTRAFGIPALRQETAYNASAGLALNPLDRLSITVDGYLIHVDDRVVLTGRFANSDATIAEILAPFPSVSQAQFFANAVDTSTRGVDLVAEYTLDFRPSAFTFTLAGNLSRTEVSDVHLPRSLLGRATGGDTTLRDSFFGRQERGRLEDAVPHQRAVASVRYRLTAFSALVRASYYGKVEYKADDPMNDESFGAKVLFDTEVSYEFTRYLRLTVGAYNVFNTFPDRLKNASNTSFGRFVYSRAVSQFGQNGGFYYARLSLSWL